MLGTQALPSTALPHPPALKAPFMGLLHAPLGRPDKTASVGIIFLFPDGSVFWLHPGPPITAWGLETQRQVNIRRQQEEKATRRSCSQSAGLLQQGSLGGIFLGHFRGPGSQVSRKEKGILLFFFFKFFKEALQCFLWGWGPPWSSQVICGAELHSPHAELKMVF